MRPGTQPQPGVDARLYGVASRAKRVRVLVRVRVRVRVRGKGLGLGVRFLVVSSEVCAAACNSTRVGAWARPCFKWQCWQLASNLKLASLSIYTPQHARRNFLKAVYFHLQGQKHFRGTDDNPACIYSDS